MESRTVREMCLGCRNQITVSSKTVTIIAGHTEHDFPSDVALNGVAGHLNRYT